MNKVIKKIRSKLHLDTSNLPEEIYIQMLEMVFMSIIALVLCLLFSLMKRTPRFFLYGIALAIFAMAYFVWIRVLPFLQKNVEYIEGRVIQSADEKPRRKYERTFLRVKVAHDYYTIPVMDRSLSIPDGALVRVHFRKGESERTSNNSIRTREALLIQVLEEPEEV